MSGLRDRLGLQATLETIARDIHRAHARLSTGSLAASGAHRDMFHRPWVPSVFYYGEGHGHHHFHQIRVRSLFDAGFDVAAYANTSTRQVHGLDLTNEHRYLQRNAPQILGHAFNLSAVAYVEVSPPPPAAPAWHGVRCGVAASPTHARRAAGVRMWTQQSEAGGRLAGALAGVSMRGNTGLFLFKHALPHAPWRPRLTAVVLTAVVVGRWWGDAGGGHRSCGEGMVPLTLIIRALQSASAPHHPVGGGRGGQ